MKASDFLALAASEPEKANMYVVTQLLGIADAFLPDGRPLDGGGEWFFKMWDALPREGEDWNYLLVELHHGNGPGSKKHAEEWRYRVSGACFAAGVNFEGGGPVPHAPTRNLAVAAALSEAMHEEKDDG